MRDGLAGVIQCLIEFILKRSAALWREIVLNVSSSALRLAEQMTRRTLVIALCKISTPHVSSCCSYHNVNCLLARQTGLRISL